MAKAEARPEAKETQMVVPSAHDAPGLSPYERMMELTRRLLSVPPKELARAKRKQARERPR